MNKYNETLKITYSLFDDQVVIEVNTNTTIDSLLNYIATSHQLVPNELEILYNNKRIGFVESHKFIRDLVGYNQQPYFVVRTKSEGIPCHQVIIECFPSRPELNDMLHSFLNENNLSTNYKEEHRDGWVLFAFYESVNLFNSRRRL
jgi:hypothetical protein